MKNLRLELNKTDCFFGDLSFIHGKKENRSCAFLSNEKKAAALKIPRTVGAYEVLIECEDPRYNRAFSFQGLCGSDDIYRVDLRGFGIGLYFFRIRVRCALGEFYAQRDGRRLRFVSKSPVGFPLQISVSRFAFSEESPYLGGVIYHIFVDRFAKGARKVPLKEGARLIESWENGVPEYPAYPGAYLENNTFYGGTLYGVADRLDYLRSLGVTLIYLSPVFEAYSNHKYDTGDYMQVDPMFGGDEALALLIRRAKKRGIGIILDGVFNHTGSDSLYFNKKGKYASLGAYQSKESPYYGWYEFEEFPDRYTCWWGIPILPRIHPDRPECREYFLGKGGVIEKYAKMGIAGFRLDVADELSDSFIAGIKKKLSDENPASLLYGEVWEDASNKVAYGVRKKYYLGSELDGVMNYPLRKALLNYALNGECDELFYVFDEVFENAPSRILHQQMNLLGTHDTLRILTALGNESAEGLTNAQLVNKRMPESTLTEAKARLKMLYTVIATLPGIPMIYYADEVGMEGYSDPFNRMPYPYGKEDGALLAHYRAIGRLREENAVYKRGDFRLLSLTPEHLIFARETKKHSYVTLMNRSHSPLKIAFSEEGIDMLNDIRMRSLSLSPLETAVVKVPIDTILYFE